jgi:hypothetical protein
MADTEKEHEANPIAFKNVVHSSRKTSQISVIKKVRMEHNHNLFLEKHETKSELQNIRVGNTLYFKGRKTPEK